MISHPSFLSTQPDVASYVAARRAAAGRSMAIGHLPLKMSAPTVIPFDHDHDGRIQTAMQHGPRLNSTPIFVAQTKGPGLEMVYPDGSHRPANCDNVQSQTSLILADNEAVKRAVKLCPDRAGLIEFLSVLPLGNRVVVLTEALDRKFWTPAGFEGSRIQAWIKLLRFSGGDRFHRCLEDVTCGTATSQQGQYGREWAFQEKIVTQENERWSKVSSLSANYIYNLATSLTTIANSYLLIDPVGITTGLHAGDASEILPVSSDSRKVSCFVSSPCRVREGEIMLFDRASQFRGRLTLSHIGYDETEQCVTAEFRRPVEYRSGQRSQASAGFDSLVDCIGRTPTSSTPMRIVTRPFILKPRQKDFSPWTTTKKYDFMESVGTRRDVPHLDVLLAAQTPTEHLQPVLLPKAKG